MPISISNSVRSVNGAGGDVIVSAYIWLPPDQGMVTWTGDPLFGFSSTLALPTAGVMHFARLHMPKGATVTNIVVYLGAGGTVLTSGQCKAALYSAAGNLHAATGDQSTAWASSGLKTMALTGGPYGLPPGDVYAAWWFNGVAGPQVARSATTTAGLLNGNLSDPNLRYGTADTGLTTTAPSTMGTQTAGGNGWWVALS